MSKNCLQCNNEYLRPEKCPIYVWESRKYCSQACSRLAHPMKGNKYRLGLPSPMKGKKHKPESVEKMRTSSLGVPTWNKGMKGLLLNRNFVDNNPSKPGELSVHWKEDRSLIVKSEKKHLDSGYKTWMKAVKNRDNWKCKIANNDCSGRLEAHHILRWSDYPELRYEVNNGITLCHAHHPRKRIEENRLSPYFRSLIVNET